jgi:hypothetical protein
MDLVTITDIDSIDGCLRYLDRRPEAPHFFVSEEVRAAFPGHGAEVRVLLYGIDEATHREAQRLRGDARDLLEWTRQAGVAAVLGPSPDLVEAGGSADRLRALMSRCRGYETRNPAWGRAWGDLVARLAQEEPGCVFGTSGGSGAGAGPGVGRCHTAAVAADREEFLRALRTGRTWAVGGAHGVIDYSVDILRTLPLRGAAAPIWEHCVRRARIGVRLRRARRHLDRDVVRQFQERARFYGTDLESRPGNGAADAFGID